MEDRSKSSVVPEEGHRLTGDGRVAESPRVMEEAHLAGYDQVGRWMWSVLHEAACRTLRRILQVGSSMHSSSRRHNDDTGGNRSSSDSVLDEENLIRVESWHVSACDEFARRIGQAWAQHLEASGYNELALLLHHYLNTTNDHKQIHTHHRHSFLQEEPPEFYVPANIQQHDALKTKVGNESTRDEGGEYVTITELEDPKRANNSQDESNHIVSSRREEDNELASSSHSKKVTTLWSKLNQLGCQDASSYVPTKSNSIETGMMHPVFQPNVVGDRTAAIRAWTKQQIEQLDHDMIPNKEKRHGYGMWPYPHASIQKAVQRNKKRINLESGSKLFSADYEVIPKSMLLQTTATASQSEDEEPSEEQQLWNVKNSEAFRRYKRKRTSDHPITTEEQNTQPQKEKHVNERHTIQGRLPSSIGHEQWSSEEIAADLGTDEDRQSLLRTFIHEEVSEDTHEEPVHVVRGALKHLGLVHAWAQRRQRQPLASQDETVVEKDDNYNKDDDDRYGFDLNVVHERHTRNKDASIKRQLRMYRKARKERLFPHVADMDHKESARRASKIARANTEHDGAKEWLELDLGECVLEVMESPDEEGHPPCRKLYSFSSLEVSLLDADADEEE